MMYDDFMGPSLEDLKEQINRLIFEEGADRRRVIRVIESYDAMGKTTALLKYGEEMLALRRQARLEDLRSNRVAPVRARASLSSYTQVAVGRYAVEREPARPDVRVIPMGAQLIRQLELDPTALRLLTPGQFEEFIANRLDRMGFDVSFTGQVNQCDGGIDLVALPKRAPFGAPLMAVQVKHRSRDGSVGRSDVDRLLAWKNRPFHLGLLVTNGRITPDAFWTAAQPGNKEWARLRAFEDVKRWIENNFDRELNAAELPSAIEVRPGVWVPVPRQSFSKAS